jgi:hypothetical protein
MISSDAGSTEGEGNASALVKTKAAWSASVEQSGKHSLDQSTASCFRIYVPSFLWTEK